MTRNENQTLRRSKRIQQKNHSEGEHKNTKKIELEEKTEYITRSLQLSDGRVSVARLKKVTVRGVPVEGSAATSEETQKNHSILPNRSNRKATRSSVVSQNKKQKLSEKPRRKTNNKNTPAAVSSRIKTPGMQLSKNVTEVPHIGILSEEIPAANTVRLVESNCYDQCIHRHVGHPECLNQFCHNNTQNIPNYHSVNTGQTQTMPHVSNIGRKCTPAHMPHNTTYTQEPTAVLQKNQIQNAVSRELFPPRPNASCPQSSRSIPNPSMHQRGNINSRVPSTIHSQKTSYPVQNMSLCCNCINTCHNIHQANHPLPDRGQIDLANLPLTQHFQPANTVQHLVYYVNPPVSNSLAGSVDHCSFQNQESGKNTILPSCQRQSNPAHGTATPQVLNSNKYSSQPTQQQHSNSRQQTQQHTVFFPFCGPTPVEIEIK